MGIGWFSSGAPPAPALLDGLVAWNPIRGADALLVLLGLLLAAHLLGRDVGRPGPASVRPGLRVLLLATVLVLGGLVTFAVVSTAPEDEGVVAIRKLDHPVHQVSFAPSVWTHEQAVAALVVAVGLLVGAYASAGRTRG